MQGVLHCLRSFSFLFISIVLRVLGMCSLVTPYCVFKSLPNWCLRLCVLDQTVIGWRYFTEPGVLEGQLLMIPVFWL